MEKETDTGCRSQDGVEAVSVETGQPMDMSPTKRPKQSIDERREKKRIYMKKRRQEIKTSGTGQDRQCSARGQRSADELANAARNYRKKYNEKKLQQFADSAIDQAMHDLYSSAACAQQDPPSNTLIPGSQPNEKSDEVIEGQSTFSSMYKGSTSERESKEPFIRGLVCSIETPGNLQRGWKCNMLSKPSWSKINWPTGTDYAILEFTLSGLVRQLRLNRPGTEIDLKAADFLPLPDWASEFGKRHPFLPCIDLDTYGWDTLDFIRGLEISCKLLQGGDNKKMWRFVDLFVDTARGNEHLREILSADAQSLRLWNDRTLRCTGKHPSATTGRELFEFTRGIHLGFVISRAKEAWSFPYHSENPCNFMKSLITEVDQERKNLIYCREWLRHQRSVDYPYLTAVIEGSIPLRLQKVCYLVDSIREFSFGWENHRQRYMNGMCTFEVGWFQRPRIVTQCIMDIIGPASC